MYQRENRWRQTFVVDGERRSYYPRSQESLDRNLEIAKKRGWQVLERCTKLYPYNIENNQHNFELIMNLCANRMSEMESGEIEFDQAEYDKLERTREDAEECWDIAYMRSRENPNIAWIDGKLLGKAKELAMAAIEHRANACIRNGRPDLVMYC